MNNCSVVNILDLLDTFGEDMTIDILSDFHCPKNEEIELFVRRNAIDFARRKISITHLVFDDDGNIVGIFSLAHKAIELSGDGLSRMMKRKIERYAQFDQNKNSYTVSAFLIAQFGKNYNVCAANDFSGDDLMENALKTLRGVQRDVGGGIVYLDCEDHPKLLSFYQNERNCFRIFGERYSHAEGKKYIQLLRLF